MTMSARRGVSFAAYVISVVLLVTNRAVSGQEETTALATPQVNCEWGGDESERRFVRVPETTPVGTSILAFSVSEPELLRILPEEQSEVESELFAVKAEGAEGRLVVASPLQPVLARTSTIVKLAVACGDNQAAQQVTVYVEDENDHAPLFETPFINITVDELTPVGLTILREIRVTDGDRPNTANSEVHLQLVAKEEEAQQFILKDSKTGVVTLGKPLDFDLGPRVFQFIVIAKDQGTPAQSSTATVLVNVKDADDQDPVFTSSTYTSSVLEHAGPAAAGLPVRQELRTRPGPIRAHDGDLGLNATLKYQLVSSDISRLFAVDPITGALFLVSFLDRELLRDDLIVLHVQAVQVDNPRRVATAEVRVNVVDINDNEPQFEHSEYAISVVENLPKGFSVVRVKAHDVDLGENSVFTYHLQEPEDALAISPASGWLTVSNQSRLDREVQPSIALHVCARQVVPAVSSLQKVDERGAAGIESPPRSSNFSSPADIKRIPSVTFSSMNLVNRVTPEATTTDATPREGVRGGSSGSFSKTPMNTLQGMKEPGNITHALERFSFEDALSNRTKGVSSTLPPSHTPVDIVRKPPAPTFFLTSLVEEEEGGAHSGTNTSLPYGAKNIPKRNKRRAQQIDPAYRRLLVANKLPKGPIHTPRNRNQGGIGGLSFVRKELVPSSSCTLITIKLLDANDNNPIFRPSNRYAFNITEESQPGEVIGKVTAEDADEGDNGHVVYNLQSKTGTGEETIFSIDPETGTLTLLATLDAGQTLTLFVEASDSPTNPSERRVSVAIVTISVKAVHLGAPRFVGAPFEFWVGGDAKVGTSVGQVRVEDLEGPELQYDMFHDYRDGVPFAIEETSGIVSVVAPLERFSRPRYDFETVVTDGLTSLATNVSVSVAPPARLTARRDVTLTYTVQENVAGALLGNIVDTLKARGTRVVSDPRFELITPSAREYFGLAQDSTLYTLTPLDFERSANHTLVVVSARTSDIYYVHVKVEDVNDNPPQLNANSYSGSIHEDAQRGTSVIISPRVSVSDADSYPGSAFSLRLEGDAAHLFAINSSSLFVTYVGGNTKEELDREKVTSYSLTLIASDDGNLTSKAALVIAVEDVNDNAPIFLQDEPQELIRAFGTGEEEDSSSRRMPDSPPDLERLTHFERSLIRVPESLIIGSRVTQVLATDLDDKVFGDIRYAVINEQSFQFGTGDSTKPVLQQSNGFSIDAKSGEVLVSGRLKPNQLYLLNVSATDGGGLSSFHAVFIASFDVNDHPPEFERPVYNFQVLEGDYLVGEVGKVVAHDEDYGNNARLHYQIILNENWSDDQEFPFRISETSGTLLATGPVDREKSSHHEFSVVASDSGEPQLSASIIVQIEVMDVNDHSPAFYGYDRLQEDNVSVNAEDNFDENLLVENAPTPVYLATVAENTPPGTPIATVFANDTDSSSTGGGVVIYKLASGQPWFELDSQNGTIYTVSPLDYESWETYDITVEAWDLGRPARSSRALVHLTIEKVAEKLSRRLFDQREYKVGLLENNDVPFRLLKVDVSSWYASGSLHYEVVPEGGTPHVHDLITVDSLSGEVYLIASLDREVVPFLSFRVRASRPSKGRTLHHLHRQTNASSHALYIRMNNDTSPESQSTSQPSTPASRPSFLRDVASNRTSQNRSSAPKEPVGTRMFFPQAQKTRGAAELSTLALDEVRIVLVVEDVNDNAPSFNIDGRPIVAAVPASASFGHPVVRVLAHDPDQGANGQIRYEILTGDDTQALETFGIDSVTGQVEVLAPLQFDGGRLYGFDVRASDQGGEPGPHSAIANVFVHVLDQEGHVVVEVGAAPRDVEPHLHFIQGMLGNVSGLDVRVQKLEPHLDHEGDAEDISATDVYVYAVNPDTNALLEARSLRKFLGDRQEELQALMPQLKGLREVQVVERRDPVLQKAELALLIAAVVIFMTTFIALVFLCHRQRKRRKPVPIGPFITASGVPMLPLAYPGPFVTTPYAHMSDQSSATDSTEGGLDHQFFLKRPGVSLESSRYRHQEQQEVGNCLVRGISGSRGPGEPRASKKLHRNMNQNFLSIGGHQEKPTRRVGGDEVGAREQEEESESGSQESDDRNGIGAARLSARGHRPKPDLPTVDCSLPELLRSHSPDSLESSTCRSHTRKEVRAHAHSGKDRKVTKSQHGRSKRDIEGDRNDTGRGTVPSSGKTSESTEL